MQTTIKYQVIDRHTNKIVGTYKTLRTACHAVNRLDNIYGGYRYHHKRIEIAIAGENQ